MNIAFITSTRTWAGVKTWYLSVAESLQALGNNVFLYARHEAFLEEAAKRLAHVQHVDFGADLSPFTIQYFYKEFQRYEIDIVIVNVGKELSTAAVAAKLLGIPVIQRIGLPGDIKPKLKPRLLHAFIKPFFFCPCDFIAQGFQATLPYVKPSDCAVIHTGKTLGPVPTVCHTPRRLLLSSRLAPEKGQADILHALASVSAPWELHIAGTGPEEGALRALAEELGISAHIAWHGFVTDVQALLRECDIFLLPSYMEGLPNTLSEALAEGALPIIRNVGGVLELIPPALLPWVLPFKAKPEDFARLIEQALALPDEELLALRLIAHQTCIDRCEAHAQHKKIEAFLRLAVLPMKK